MKVELELNPDEALALIQICERDVIFPEVSLYVISELERYRREWAADVADEEDVASLYNKPDAPTPWRESKWSCRQNRWQRHLTDVAVKAARRAKKYAK